MSIQVDQVFLPAPATYAARENYMGVQVTINTVIADPQSVKSMWKLNGIGDGVVEAVEGARFTPSTVDPSLAYPLPFTQAGWATSHSRFGRTLAPFLSLLPLGPGTSYI